MRKRTAVCACIAALMALVLVSGCSPALPERLALRRCTQVTLSDSGSTSTGKAVVIEGRTVTITASGSYCLRGTLSDGQLVVDAGENAEVRLVLSGISLVKNGGAAIRAESAKALVLMSAKGSENLIQSRGVYAQSRESAALYADCALRLCGDGVLNVSSLTGHALLLEDACVLKSGTVNLETAQKGLYSRGCVTFAGGVLNADVGDDAICVENGSAGAITLSGGALNLLAQGDGLDASGDISISGGALTVNAGSGGEGNALKAGGSIRKTGGDVSLRAAAEAVSAAGEIIFPWSDFDTDQADYHAPP